MLEDANVSAEDLKTEEDLAKLPTVHANFFKQYVVLSVPMEEITEHATSSGTSGQKSQMFFDRDSFAFGRTSASVPSPTLPTTAEPSAILRRTAVSTSTAP